MPRRQWLRLSLCVALVFAASTVRGQEWRCVWSDEFDADGRPDPAKWGFEHGFLRNREAQYYRPENARVSGGKLIIEARKESPAGLNGRGSRSKPVKYTSASVITKGKASWTHGRIEVRAKIPTGRGTWPAIWLLGDNIDKVGWPRCGEVDIMENVGFDPEKIHANIHTEKYNHVKHTGKGSSLLLDKPWADFHVYAVEWDHQRMDFLVDGKKYFTYENELTGTAAWPYDGPLYLILNVAIGGDWGGQKGIDDAIFPQRMEVDYVRVYEKAPSGKPPRPARP